MSSWSALAQPTEIHPQLTQNGLMSPDCLKLEHLLLQLRVTSISNFWPWQFRIVVHTWKDNEGVVGHLNRLLKSNCHTNFL